MKKDLSFFEVYGKVIYTINDKFAIGAQRLLHPVLPELGRRGNYVSGTVS